MSIRTCQLLLQISTFQLGFNVEFKSSFGGAGAWDKTVLCRSRKRPRDARPSVDAIAAELQKLNVERQQWTPPPHPQDVQMPKEN